MHLITLHGGNWYEGFICCLQLFMNALGLNALASNHLKQSSQAIIINSEPLITHVLVTCTVSMPWTDLRAHIGIAERHPIPPMRPGSYGIYWLISRDARQLSMRCTYGFLALHLPLGNHVLFYASGTVEPGFPATAAPWDWVGLRVKWEDVIKLWDDGIRSWILHLKWTAGKQ